MIDIDIFGTDYPVPSGAADTNWAAQQIAFEQALASAVNRAPRVLSLNVTPVGTGADTTEDNLMTYALPADTLSVNRMGVRVTAMGTGVNTADATTVRAYFGSTAVASKVLTASQANSWKVVFEVFRTGAATQIASGFVANGGTATDIAQASSLPSATLSGAVTIKLTGQRASSSVADSVAQYFMLVELIPVP